MDYTIISKITETCGYILEGIYSFFEPQYAIAGISNTARMNVAKPESWLENACLSSSEHHKKGRTRLHEPNHQITIFSSGKKRIIDIPKEKGCSLKDYLISCGLSPKRATKEIKNLH
jgi:hypothetical protein